MGKDARVFQPKEIAPSFIFIGARSPATG